MTNNSLYRQEILEHYRNPQNHGKLRGANLKAEKINELCGDELILQIKLDHPLPRLHKKKKRFSSPLLKDGVRGNRIIDIKFTGSGCALSIASASMLTKKINGKTLAQAKKITPSQVIKNLGVKVGPARKKCVLLVYDALQEILHDKKRNSEKTK